MNGQGARRSVMINVRLTDDTNDENLNSSSVIASRVESDALTVADWTRHIIEDIGCYLPQLCDRVAVSKDTNDTSKSFCLNYGAGYQTVFVPVNEDERESSSFSVGLSLTENADTSEALKQAVLNPFDKFWDILDAFGTQVWVWIRTDSAVTWPHFEGGNKNQNRRVAITSVRDGRISLLIPDASSKKAPAKASQQRRRKVSVDKTTDDKANAKAQAPAAKKKSGRKASEDKDKTANAPKQQDVKPAKDRPKKVTNEAGFTLNEEQKLMLAFCREMTSDEPLNMYRFNAFEEGRLIDAFLEIMEPEGEPVTPMVLPKKTRKQAPSRNKEGDKAVSKSAESNKATSNAGNSDESTNSKKKAKTKKAESLGETPKEQTAPETPKKKTKRKNKEGQDASESKLETPKRKKKRKSLDTSEESASKKTKRSSGKKKTPGKPVATPS